MALLIDQHPCRESRHCARSESCRDVPGLVMCLVFQGVDYSFLDCVVYLFGNNECLSVTVASLIVPIWAGMRCSVVESSTIKSCLDF